MPTRNALILFIFFWLTIPVQAQDVPQIRNFKPTDYQGQNQNWSLTQGREGWLYAANNGGLLAFDGVRWETHFLPEKQTLRTLATDADGRVFCGAFAEFGYWQADAGGQLRYTSLSETLSPNQLGKEEIWHILVRPGEVLFQSFSLIYKYDYQAVVVIKPPASIMFAHEVNGRVLVPVIGQGLYELQSEGNFRELPNTRILKDKIVQFITTGPKGDPWVGTANDGIFILQNQLCKPLEHPLNNVFKRAQLNRAHPLKSGGLAIGTIREGALVLDGEGNFRHHLNRKNGLQNNTVLALHEDNIGNLWIGLDKGIDLVELRAPLAFFSDQSGQIGTVYCAAEHNGFLYIGANQGVFCRPLKGGDFHLVAGTQGQAWDLQVFDNQLICGHNSGTFLLKNGRSQKISHITGGWYTLRVPEHDHLLLQCTYTGLVLFKRQGNADWQLVNKLNGFTGPLRRILFDDSGVLWGVHPNRGLFRFKLDSVFSKVLQIDYYEKSNGLAADYQLDLCKIGPNVIVQGPATAQEIQRNEAEVHFRDWKAPRQARKWLPVGRNLFFKDDNGLNLWLPELTMPIGVNLVPNFEKIVQLSKERFLFCLENGFATMDMSQFLAQARPANNFQVLVRRLETWDGKSYGKQPDPALSYRQNSLKLLFTVSNFVPSPRFSWYLDGFSRVWSEPQYMAEKEFTNLPEGKYTFRVRSGNSEDSFSFTIMPPWYRSTWAFLTYFLLTVLLFWSIERYNRRRLARLQQRLEQEKEHELLVLEVDNKNRELSNAAFNLIRKNETLQGLKEELAENPKDHRALDKIIRQIDAHLDSDHDWQVFEEAFNRAHDDFFKRLMHDFPELKPGDLRLAAYLKMNLSSKEIAPLLNISIRGVENKRYRLRKKLELPEDANLAEFIIAY